MRILKFRKGFIKLDSIDGAECDLWSSEWRVCIYFGGGKQYETLVVPNEREGLRKVEKLMQIITCQNKGSNIIIWEEI